MPRKNAVVYRITDPRLEATPNSGLLYACRRNRRDMHVPNNATQAIDCGVEIDVPDGVTVAIRPLPDWELSGIRLVAQHLVGPLNEHPVEVVVHNHRGGTIRFDDQEPIATVTAYETPPALLWRQDAEKTTEDRRELIAPEKAAEGVSEPVTESESA